MNNNYQYYNGDERLVGGFAAPFLLGGITGGLLAPAFYRPPYYGPGPFYGPRPPYYGPIYGPRPPYYGPRPY